MNDFIFMMKWNLIYVIIHMVIILFNDELILHYVKVIMLLLAMFMTYSRKIYSVFIIKYTIFFNYLKKHLKKS